MQQFFSDLGNYWTFAAGVFIGDTTKSNENIGKAGIFLGDLGIL
jgi:hypothetical protein